MRRFGWVIGLNADRVEEYKRLHAAVWPEVLKTIRDCHIRNYSIYLRQLDDGQYYLFSYLEYVGMDFAADMAKMAVDSMTQKWWSVCKPCQRPLTTRRNPQEWWSDLEEVFHLD